MTGILSGLKVVESAAFVAAPLGGMTLAQLGAEVIRIDPIQGGLDYRRWPVDSGGASLYWAGLNKGKRSVAIDIQREEGRELAQALMVNPDPEAGIVVTNFPARGWLSFEALKRRRQDLIMINIQGHANGGQAVDYTVNCGVGIPFSTGEADSNRPVNNALPAWDIATGMMAAVAVLAAERHRRNRGEGQMVKLALADVAYAMMGNLGYIAEAQLQGEARKAEGNQVFGAFGKNFSSGDGKQFMLVAITGRQWRNLCKATGLDAQFKQVEEVLGVDLGLEGDRYRARAFLNSLVEEWAKERGIAEIAEAFERSGVCWGRYRDVSEMLAEEPRCSADGPLFEEVTQPGIGSYRMPRTPLFFERENPCPVQPAPRLGEHTAEVLAAVLGLTDGAVGDLVQRKIVAVC